MDKDEFITEVLNLYSKGFYIGVSEVEGKKAKTAWIKACHTVLPKNVNFNGLWFQFLKEFDCKTISSIPSPQWLYKESQNFLKNTSTYTEQRIDEKKNFKGDPPPVEFFKMGRLLKEKMEQRSNQLKEGLNVIR